jgi:trimeric autotransporter adhesin
MAVVLCGPGAADERVGVNSGVNPAGTGTPPNGPARQLVIGQDVIFKEQVATDTRGQTQILFLDQSSMSVGPNSDLVIDEFVYDPHLSTGKLVLSSTRGVFRYVGGKISKLEGGVEVETPVATIGIRGGAFLLQVSKDSVAVVLLYGDSLVITGPGGRQTVLRRASYGVTIGADGTMTPPFLATQDYIQTFIALLDGRAGGNGGARVIPTDQRVAISGIGNTVSARLEANTQAALKQAGYSCRGGSMGLQAVAGRLVARCSLPYDPGYLPSALSVNSAEYGRPPVTPVATPTPTPTPTPAPTPTPVPLSVSMSQSLF